MMLPQSRIQITHRPNVPTARLPLALLFPEARVDYSDPTRVEQLRPRPAPGRFPFAPIRPHKTSDWGGHAWASSSLGLVVPERACSSGS